MSIGAPKQFHCPLHLTLSTRFDNYVIIVLFDSNPVGEKNVGIGLDVKFGLCNKDG